MLTIILGKSARGTEIQITSADQPLARRVYNNILRASLKADKCTKTLYHGPVRSGEYTYLIHVPGLEYELACKRMGQLWPDAERSYPQSLIGG